MKAKLLLPAALAALIFLLNACGGKAARSPDVSGSTVDTASTVVSEPDEAVHYPLSFTSLGETVRLEAVGIPDYSPIESVPTGGGPLAAPSIDGYIKYCYDSSLYSFVFDDGSLPVYEKYWFYRDGELVTAGAAGVTPDAEGKYLLYIDFMFADGGAVTARRAAVEITLTKYADYDALRAAGVPRGVEPGETPLSAEYRAWLEERGDTVFDAGTDDPEEAMRHFIELTTADELASDDPFYKLDALKILDVELCGKSYLDLYNVFVVRYSSAVKPSSQSYRMIQYPMDTNIWGTGELDGWLLSEDLAYLKYFGNGVWCSFDHVWGAAYQPACGLTSCAADESLWKKVYPANPVIPDYGERSALLNQPWFLLEDPDKIDWEEMRAVSGLEYSRYMFALVRANAFNSLPNRTSLYGGILGEYRTYPQALRTAAVMLAANNVFPELAGDYADLLRELRAVDPDGFAYCLTQVPAERAAEVSAMIGP